MGLFSKLFGGEPADPDKVHPPAASVGGSGRRVLLVESSLMVRKVMELALPGDRITSVGDAAAARKKSGEASFDVAVINAGTVDDGYDLGAELKPKMPVIVLGASFIPFDEARARAAGADAILMVPFQPAELQAAIARVTSAFR